jgi:Flp pilus assembly protein TadD
MFKNHGPMIRLALILAFAGTIPACEDLPSPPHAPTSATAAPPPTTVTPEPKPETAPDGAKGEDDDKPVDKLAAARRLLDAGDADKALALAKVAVLERPKRSAAWNVLGRAQLRGGKRKDAIASFEKAVELNPESSYARNNLGLALIYDGQYEKAVDSLEEAVELEPVTGYMWNNLGMAYEQLDRLDEARDAYDKAATMESDRARASLARLKGVESVIRTAKAEPELKVGPDAVEAPTVGPTTMGKGQESPSVTE